LVERAASSARAGEIALDALGAADHHMIGAGNALRGQDSRASARKRRFMRLRTTAPPIFLVTVKPTRIAGRRPRGRGQQDEAGHGPRACRVGGEEVGALLDRD
jgi:hypothetical protein